MRTADKKLELPRFRRAGWCFLKQAFNNQSKTFICRYVTIWLWMEKTELWKLNQTKLCKLKCKYYIPWDVSWSHNVYWGPSYSTVTESWWCHIEIGTEATAAWCREKALLQCYSCITVKLFHSWDSSICLLLFSLGEKWSFMCNVYKRCSVSAAQVSVDVCNVSLISGLL